MQLESYKQQMDKEMIFYYNDLEDKNNTIITLERKNMEMEDKLHKMHFRKTSLPPIFDRD